MDLKKWAGSKLGVAEAEDSGGELPPDSSSDMDMGGPNPLFNDVDESSLPPEMASWAVQGGSDPNHPKPSWATDGLAYQYALALVQKNWQDYLKPWVIVAAAYNAMAKPVAAAGKPVAPVGPKPPVQQNEEPTVGVL